MKTPQELSEMAEREYPKEESGMYIAYREGFIKGYQAAQEEMKQSIEQFLDFSITKGYFEDIPKGQKEGLIYNFINRKNL